MQLRWTEDLNTGLTRIDEEHREIYRQLNEIGESIQKGADDTTLIRLAEVLLDYSYLHFHREEHAMACSRCPFHEANCSAHRYFLERLRIWMCMITSGQVPRSLISDLHHETSSWIKNHIEQIDIGLRSVGTLNESQAAS